jgi:hypothetical protein
MTLPTFRFEFAKSFLKDILFGEFECGGCVREPSARASMIGTAFPFPIDA